MAVIAAKCLISSRGPQMGVNWLWEAGKEAEIEAHGWVRGRKRKGLRLRLRFTLTGLASLPALMCNQLLVLKLR